MTILLVLALVLPLVGIVLQVALPRPQLSRWLSLAMSVGSSAIALFAVLGLFFGWISNPHLFAYEWIPSYGVNYVFRLDGFNGPGFLATSLIFPITLIAEWNQGRGRRGLHSLILLMQTATLGSLLADDLFLQFFFYSLTLIPIFFMVSIWGKTEHAEKIGGRVVATTAIAHALMFFGILLLYYSIEPHSYLITVLARSNLAEKTVSLFGSDFSVQKVAFVFLTLGFALRLPIWPLHGWMSALVRNTPSGLLASIIAVGTPTGMLIYSRLLYQLFPEILVEYQTAMMTVGLVCLLFPVITLVSQTDHRSIGHKLVLAATGLAITGLACVHSAALTGIVVLLFSTCIAVGGYFGVAELLHARTHTYQLDQQGGILHRFPFLAICFVIFTASCIAIPGTTGFVGGALLQVGNFRFHWGVAMTVLFAFLLAAAFAVRAFQSVFLGSATGDTIDDFALSPREIACLIPLLLMVLIFGIFPSPLLAPAKEVTTLMMEKVKVGP